MLFILSIFFWCIVCYCVTCCKMILWCYAVIKYVMCFVLWYDDVWCGEMRCMKIMLWFFVMNVWCCDEMYVMMRSLGWDNVGGAGGSFRSYGLFTRSEHRQFPKVREFSLRDTMAVLQLLKILLLTPVLSAKRRQMAFLTSGWIPSVNIQKAIENGHL